LKKIKHLSRIFNKEIHCIVIYDNTLFFILREEEFNTMRIRYMIYSSKEDYEVFNYSITKEAILSSMFFSREKMFIEFIFTYYLNNKYYHSFQKSSMFNTKKIKIIFNGGEKWP